MTEQILRYDALSEQAREEVTRIFLEGFGHFMAFEKDEQNRKALLKGVFSPTLCYAFVRDEKVLGILFLGNCNERPMRFSKENCVALYGNTKGGAMASQLNAIFQSQVVKGEKDLYIDTLATTASARGQGIATKLLQYAFDLPEYKDVYIEVFSKNQNALRLYEKIGFAAIKHKRFSPLVLQGFGHPIEMKLQR